VAGRGLTTLPDPGHQGVIADDWFTAGSPVRKHRSAKRLEESDSFWADRTDLLPFTVLARLLAELSTPPVVWLPCTGIGHTRHFFRVASGRSTGSAVFDTFAAIDFEQSIVFEWPDLTLAHNDVERASKEEKQLQRLLSRLLYFGRSESWCDAELEGVAFKPGDTHWPCVAVEDDTAFTKHFARQGLREYRDYAVEKRLGWDSDQSAFLRGEFRAPEADEPELLVRALLQQTGESMKHGDRPWGTRWLHYAVPREIFRLPVRRGAPRVRPAQSALQPCLQRQAFRYAINTATVHKAALPPLTATLAIAQQTRAAAMAIFGRQNAGLCSPQLSGKRFREDERRYELFTELGAEQVVPFCNGVGSHSDHSYWWPVDEDGDGFLDHVIVLCKSGFSDRDAAALRALSRVRQHGSSRSDLLLTLLFEGKWEDCPSSLARPGPTADFVSATPYFCPVHLTRRSGRRRSLKAQIGRSLQESYLPAADRIDEIVFDYDPSSLGRLGQRDPRRHFAAHVQNDLKGAQGELLVERGGIAAGTLTALMPIPATDLEDIRYPNACVRDPDDPVPLGMSHGLMVAAGQRFVPSLAFCRVRTTDDRAKGRGVMLRVRFGSSQPARPFAVGKFCHFGLGLFVPLVGEHERRDVKRAP
jgi:CRISPR-associated protein Csb2